MPAIEKDKSLVVKSVMASQKVVQGRLTALAWRKGIGVIDDDRGEFYSRVLINGAEDCIYRRAGRFRNKD